MPFQEAHVGHHPAWMKPIRELGVQIAGTAIEVVLEQFKQELKNAGIHRLKPSFYLSDEWGVPFDTTAIAIPFYLARTDLIGLHAEQVGFIEGATPAELLRYLRHEMGHVVNYGYKLYDREDWINLFGSIDQPYIEEYRPEPFHRAFVQHLPGWYAQKHPDEDWAETFAVWLTPQRDWKTEYATRPQALAKLNFCDHVMAELSKIDPQVTSTETDAAVEAMTCSLHDFYSTVQQEDTLPPGLDGSLRVVFTSAPDIVKGDAHQFQPAAEFLHSIELDLLADVYRWTGHFPERTRVLTRHLAKRADEMQLFCERGREVQAALAVTALVTALAMNHVQRGAYAP